ncbi:MAG: 50S ribosomal protein L17 [Candidatus Limimorpha sp.]
MRHNKKINHLGRKAAHRGQMLANMACSLILEKRIITTVAKAKALRMYVEPMITRSKDDSTTSRRTVFAMLHNKYAVSELFREVSQKVANRPGGYTRIIKLGNRPGDSADMCLMELVDYNEVYTNAKKVVKAPKATRRGGRKKTESVATETEAPKAE